MLQIVIPEREVFDEAKSEFITIKETKLNLEHSLISISKWESKWKKPFLDKRGRTFEESIDYIRCMTLNSGVDPKVYFGITQDIFDKVTKYIEDPMSATWFNEKENKKQNSSQVVTSELIYYWLIAYEIPFECEKWHLNRLLTLIRVCDIKNAPNQKMKKSDLYSRNRALNAARRKSLGTHG